MSSKRIVVIDGQGGSIGKIIVEQLKKRLPDQRITALGTNSVATSVMMKAGADEGATGENPILVACEKADLIVGPLGILAANALLGEITPLMAAAIGKSSAEKILIPAGKCRLTIVGLSDQPLGEYINQATALIQKALTFDSKNKSV